MKMKIPYLLHLLCAIALCGFVRLDKLVVQHTTGLMEWMGDNRDMEEYFTTDADAEEFENTAAGLMVWLGANRDVGDFWLRMVTIGFMGSLSTAVTGSPVIGTAFATTAMGIDWLEGVFATDDEELVERYNALPPDEQKKFADGKIFLPEEGTVNMRDDNKVINSMAGAAIVAGTAYASPQTADGLMEWMVKNRDMEEYFIRLAKTVVDMDDNKVIQSMAGAAIVAGTAYASPVHGVGLALYLGMHAIASMFGSGGTDGLPPPVPMDNTTTTYPCLSPVYSGVYDNPKAEIELYTHTKWQDLSTFYRQKLTLFYGCDDGNVSSSTHE